MSYGFENQILTFCDNCILFCTFFCQGTFFVTGLLKFDKIKIFFSLVRRMSVENLKFLVRLGKTPTEALTLFQEVYGDDTMPRTCLLSGTGGLKREERRWKIITEVEGHPQAEQMKVLSVWDKTCGAIAILLLEW